MKFVRVRLVLEGDIFCMLSGDHNVGLLEVLFHCFG